MSAIAIGDRLVAKGDKIVFRRTKPDGYIFHNAEVLEVHSALPVLKVIWFTGGTNPKAKQEWVRVEDCAWSKPV
jgi:hypothetical protein